MKRLQHFLLLCAVLLQGTALPALFAVEPGHWQLSGVHVYGPDNAPDWMSVNGTSGVLKMRAEAGGGWLETGVTWSNPENEYPDQGRIRIQIEATGDRSEAPLGGYDLLPWFEVSVVDVEMSATRHDPGTDIQSALADSKGEVMFLLQDGDRRGWSFKKTLSTTLPMRYGDYLKSPMYLDFALVPGPGARTDVVYEYTWIDDVAATAGVSGRGGRSGAVLAILLLVLAAVILLVLRRIRKRRSPVARSEKPDTAASTDVPAQAAPVEKAEPAADRAKFCSECGVRLEPGDAFCPECGARVD